MLRRLGVVCSGLQERMYFRDAVSAMRWRGWVGVRRVVLVVGGGVGRMGYS